MEIKDISSKKYDVMREKVEAVAKAMNAVWDEWERNFDDFDGILCEKYPFEHSFDEVCLSVATWAESIKANN